MRRIIKNTVLATLMSSAAMMGTAATAAENDPLQIIVSLNDQHMRVYRGTEMIASSNISSGKKGHTTPTGIFSVLQKNKHHRSNIYNNARMPYMQRLTWSGIALHASNSVPRHPASHGCVRMPHKFANKLFKMRTNGMHVIIENETRSPTQISHEALFQPKTTWTASADYDGWVNAHIETLNTGFVNSDHRYPARIFVTRRTHKEDLADAQRLLNKLGFEAGDEDGLMGPATWKAITAFQEANSLEANGKLDGKLISLMFSKAGEIRPANGRILVRKHHKTIYEAQINIQDAAKPLGSHLFTVSGFDPDSGKTDWLVTTLNDRVHRKVNLSDGNEVDPTTGRFNPQDALSRIQMSDHDREQISRFLSKGSSLTISDNGMSIETGKKGTDFIVLSKPQSGLKQIASN
jgi:hypothetical protein